MPILELDPVRFGLVLVVAVATSVVVVSMVSWLYHRLSSWSDTPRFREFAGWLLVAAGVGAVGTGLGLWIDRPWPVRQSVTLDGDTIDKHPDLVVRVAELQRATAEFNNNRAAGYAPHWVIVPLVFVGVAVVIAGGTVVHGAWYPGRG